MDNKERRTFPLRGVQTHRPFDETSESICADIRDIIDKIQMAISEKKHKIPPEDVHEEEAVLATLKKKEIKRRTLSSRLQASNLFYETFYKYPKQPSEYHFRVSEKDGKDSCVLNFHWETVPLIRAYYRTKAKWNTLKVDGDSEAVLDLLSAYKIALEEEPGLFFSAFRDTDPLYCNLVMKEHILALIPERISLLLVTTILGSSIGGIGRLIATVQGLDAIIDQNIIAILNNSSDSDNLDQIIKDAFDSFDFEQSIENLYERLEKERPAEQPDATYMYNGKENPTFGIKTYSEMQPLDEDYLRAIFEYLDAADKNSEKNIKYYKKQNPINHKKIKCLERCAKNSYDLYRANHLSPEMKNASDNFQNAVKTLEVVRHNADRTDLAKMSSLAAHKLLYMLIVYKLHVDKNKLPECSLPCNQINDTNFREMSFSCPTIIQITEKISNNIEEHIQNQYKENLDVSGMINDAVDNYLKSEEYQNMVKCTIAKPLIQTKIQDMCKMPDNQQATSLTKDQQGIDKLFEDAINNMFMQFYYNKKDNKDEHEGEGPAAIVK